MKGVTGHSCLAALAATAALLAVCAAPAAANHQMTSASPTWVDAASGMGASPLVAAKPPPARAAQLAKAVNGQQRRAVLLCDFPDSPAQVKTKANFEGLYSLLGDYYDEVSYGAIDFSSTVYDWRDLPENRAYYGVGAGDGTPTNTDLLAQDCGNVHDGPDSIDFTQFQGVDIVLGDMESGAFGAAGIGGRNCNLNLDSVFSCWPVTWIPATKIDEDGLALWAHETGHSLGLPHTIRPGGSHYWDPMGFPCGWRFVNEGAGAFDPNYGCFPVHYLAAHLDKDFLGWIPGNRRATVKPGKKATVNLERLAQPADNGNDLIARVPIKGGDPDCPGGFPGNCAPYYTAEARMGVAGSSFDNPANLPGDGVVITKVTRGCIYGQPPCEFDYVPVQVQSEAGQTDEDSSVWVPGEKFKAGKISIKVTDQLAQGFKVKVKNG